MMQERVEPFRMGRRRSKGKKRERGRNKGCLVGMEGRSARVRVDVAVGSHS